MSTLSRQIVLLSKHQAYLSRALRSLPHGPSRFAVARLLLEVRRQQRRLEQLALALEDAETRGTAATRAGDPAAVEWAAVRSVPDGDGLRLVDGRRVRYLGIDAPEIGGQGQPAQPWAEDARALNRLLVVGRRVRLVRDTGDVDAHGRLLRYVFCDGQFVNAQLLLAGLATLLIVPPDTRYTGLLRLCQEAAQEARMGMWANSPKNLR